ncbi:Condensin-2 complex subunit H2 [Auxenochlorella protothecoides]|uniref:Condensin-2 complex subunit H2 n=1 Tax=Auxenochlorella protothecoides TaxID=3075 RepID=A0A087SMV7_AUXPR|nr:Condensin-2 complex subunit H2 [Auxenochlorella protothecoides]KFM27061.1 Condensin-2 complex subunit H2 [Auxenochlorella protothecoides]
MQAEERFAHLLQPIRDLAANWNVKIATELDEYLDALENIAFTFEGGSSLNFAEAALVIQGSACVYSKKVEYLHTLVFQALEYLAESREGKNGAKKRAGTAKNDDDDDSDIEEDEAFLSLDDLEEGKYLDLDEGAGDKGTVAPLRPPATLLALTGIPQKEGDAAGFRVHSCAVHVSGALLLESADGMHLDAGLQPTDATQGVSGDAFGRPREDASGYGQPDAGGVPTADNPLEDDWGGQEYGGDYMDDDDDRGDLDGGYGGSPGEPDARLGVATAAMAAPGKRAGELSSNPAAFDSEEESEDLYDPYTPLDPNDSGPVAPKPLRKALRVPNKPRNQRPAQPFQTLQEAIHRAVPPDGLFFREFAYGLPKQARTIDRRATAASSRPHHGLQAAFDQEDDGADLAGVQEADEFDDAKDDYDGGYDGGFEADDYENVPIPSADGLDGDDLLVSAAAAEGWRDPTLTSTAFQTGIDGSCVDATSMTFDDLLKAHISRMIAAAAAAQVQTELASRVGGWRSRIGPVLEEEDARPAFDIHVYGQRVLDAMQGLSLREPDDGGYDGGFEADDYENVPIPSADGLDGDDLLVSAAAAEGWRDPTLTSTAFQTGIDGSCVDATSMTFDDLLKAHISRMIAAAAAAQVQTELASRVGGWRSRIGPVLEEEDARPAFDIHVYGQRVLDAMQGLSLREPGTAAESVPAAPTLFSEVVQWTANRFEVSRTFSSLLQLINNGNVGISKPADRDTMRFTLTLLDAHLPHEAAAEDLATQMITSSQAASQKPMVELAGEENSVPAPDQALAQGTTNTMAKLPPRSKRHKA